MEKDVINLTYEISDLIADSDFYQRLNVLKVEIQEDENLQALEKDFIACQEKIIALEEFGSETEKSEARKTLSKIKYQLDVDPLMIEYNQALKELNKVYEEINTKVFRKFVTHRSCKI